MKHCALALSCYVALAIPVHLVAQDFEREQPRGPSPFASVGSAYFVGDFGEGNRTAAGATTLLGLRYPAVSVATSLSFWPAVRQFRLTALHLEFMGDLAAERALTPYLVAGVGHTWGSFGGTGPADPPSGTSAAAGLGVRVHLWSRLSLSTDGRLRTDGGGWNADWRTMVDLGAARAVGPPLLRRTSAVVSWMSTFGGPWESVSPAFGLQMADEHGLLSVQVAHWQIPSGGGGYVWDTRAVLASVMIKRALLSDRLLLRVGPLVSAMGEGPDNGVRIGSVADLVWTMRLGPTALDISAGYLHVTRSDEPDQRGVTWSLALGR